MRAPRYIPTTFRGWVQFAFSRLLTLLGVHHGRR